MHRGDRLKNANGRFELLFDEFGDVIVYDVLNMKPIFSTGTFGTKASKLIFKSSIILLQTSSDKTVWRGFHQLFDGIHYYDDGIDGDEIYFDDIGTLKIVSKFRDKPIWSSAKPKEFHTLYENDEMGVYSKLNSPSGKISLTVSQVGISIHNDSIPAEIRTRKVDTSSNNTLLLKFVDGKLKVGLVENKQFRTLHQSNNTVPGAYVEVSEYGFVLIFDQNRNVVWSSDKNFIQHPDHVANKADDDLFPSEFFKLGGRDRILSSNGYYELVNFETIFSKGEFQRRDGYILRRAEDGTVLYRFPKPIHPVSLADTLVVQNVVVKAALEEENESTDFPGPKENWSNQFLILQDSGMLIVNRAAPYARDFVLVKPRHSISDGEKLAIGEALYSPNGEYCFEYKNYEWILYRTKDGLVLFSTNIRGNRNLDNDKMLVQDFCAFVAEGIFSIGIQGGLSIFSSGKIYRSSSKPGGDPDEVQPDRLEVINDGTLALVYDQKVVWKTPCSRRGKYDFALELKGAYLISPNKQFLLRSEAYALSLVDTISKRVLYNTGLSLPGNHSPYLMSTSSGYSLIRDKDIFWSTTGTMEKKPTMSDADKWSEDSIAVTDAGYIEIYEAGRRIWQSVSNTLYAGQTLSNSNYLLSSNHMFSFYVCKDDHKAKIGNHAGYSNREVQLAQNNQSSLTGTKFSFSNGNLQFIGNDERSVWVSGTCDGQSLHLSDDGQLSILNEDGHVVWTTQRIVCLAWGSLVWDPGSLPTTGRWYSDGPMVPVEFARQSMDGRVTLVLKHDARPVPALWGLMTSRDLSQAIRDIALREKIPTHKISETVGVWIKGQPSPSAIPHLAIWANSKGIDSVIWTNLPGKFVLKNELESGASKKKGNSTTIDRPTKEQVVDYLMALKESKLSADKKKRHLAERYIRRTPRQVRTEYRDFIEAQLDWGYDPNFD
ncbi:hypothetical protein ED236_11005 [Pseudomethylobacillus aquaticus]|uniref:Bulb-type lectin domain-containing protein n=2 Tax=Pseudomethylobacillus aquaticus TaxID=2676064 RepID=A0A3N0UXT7_9PROT|nr:hypothetical protein ED236_11005 [Pseudomethylobacillus aquaticus]